MDVFENDETDAVRACLESREQIPERAQLMIDDLATMLRHAARGRCAICGWPLAKSANEGCVQGNCSYRAHNNPDWEATFSRRAQLLNVVLQRT